MQRLIQFMLQIVIQIMLQIVMQIAENIISEVVADYIWDKIVHLDDKEEKNKMDIIYGDVIAHGIKSNNWKRMHGIPLKANAKFSLIVLTADMCQNEAGKSERKCISADVSIQVLNMNYTIIRSSHGFITDMARGEKN